MVDEVMASFTGDNTSAELEKLADDVDENVGAIQKLVYASSSFVKGKVVLY